ncbi:hypothetical protein [Acrocarpospora catenulata]|uniref:hypothetical protein n=1 Tax=Acrocarpospora catenulata TaxID=2836182 RepID=UPI001BDB0AED|nr:hypothetical protein [Acrocarpospora catenulata]
MSDPTPESSEPGAVARPARVRLHVEWAVEGKVPGSSGGYGLLACSRGGLTRKSFTDIRNRYVTGTPKELPQITIGWAGGREHTRLLLIIRRWSDQTDQFGRKIAATHYFSVPYGQLEEQRVSYEGLYHALDDADLVFDEAAPERGDPLKIDVPVLDPADLAGRVDDVAAGVAATLLSEAQVCLVGGESLTPLERLRFLDVVAALLPYGMRSRLSASTWTSGTADHDIRLSFTSTVPAAAHQVAWGSEVAVPQDGQAYYEKLVEYRDHLPEVVTLLAADLELRGFTPEARRAALVRLSRFGVTPQDPADEGQVAVFHAPAAIEGALRVCGDHLESGDLTWLTRSMGYLEMVIADREGEFGPEEQAAYREIVQARRLLAGSAELHGDLRDSLRGVVLRIAYGPVLTREGLAHIAAQLEKMPIDLLSALTRLETPDPYVRLYLAGRLGGPRLPELVRRLGVDDLVRAAAEKPYDRYVVETALDELDQRGRRDQDGNLAAALQEHGHLTEAIAFAYPRGERRVRRLRELLVAAYGPRPDRMAFAKIVPLSLQPEEALLLAAAAGLFGPDWGEAFLSASVLPALRDARYSGKDVDRIRRDLRIDRDVPVATDEPAEVPHLRDRSVPSSPSPRREVPLNELPVAGTRRRSSKNPRSLELWFWVLILFGVLTMVATLLVFFRTLSDTASGMGPNGDGREPVATDIVTTGPAIGEVRSAGGPER